MPLGLSPATLLARLIVLLIGFPVHEWAHAWSAYEMGDDTARLEGRLSLNPLAHLDILGSIMLLITGFGWAKPVPVNHYRMRPTPRAGMAISAFAGPASNFLVGLICAIPFRLGLTGSGDVLAVVLQEIALVSFGLAIFNLIPLYPLDGEKVLMGVLPSGAEYRLLEIRPFSPFILAMLLFLLPYIGLDVIGWLIGATMNPLVQFLFR